LRELAKGSRKNNFRIEAQIRRRSLCRPDESYLIVCGEQVNSPEYEFRPYVTPDGKYLFFTSNRSEEGSIWWVDAGGIDDLNPKDR
jgi:hypothetical protein